MEADAEPRDGRAALASRGPGERAGPGPDGRRERARRSREGASQAPPVGKEEVENMIQKNQCLFTDTQCKVCCALLISESQKLAHYQSKKHANKVKRYLAIHGMETLQGDTRTLGSDQNSRSRDESQCCPVCSATLSSPAVARSHYLGKTHARNLKLKQLSSKVEALSKRLPTPFLVASTIASDQNHEAPNPDKFCSLCHATFNDPGMAQQHYMGKKHRKQETKLKLIAHYGRLADPAVTDSSARKGYPCRTCKIVLNSIEQYQAHLSGFKHKNQSPKTTAAPPGQSPTQEQALKKESSAVDTQSISLALPGDSVESLVPETGVHVDVPLPIHPGTPSWTQASEGSYTPTPDPLQGTRGAGGTEDLAGQTSRMPWSPRNVSAHSSPSPTAAMEEPRSPGALGSSSTTWGVHAGPGQERASGNGCQVTSWSS